MALFEENRRPVVIAGGAIAVFLIGLLLFNLLSGGAEQGVPPLPPISPGPPVPPTVSPSPSVPPVLVGRDPFSIPAPVASLLPSASPTVSPSPTSSPTQSVTPAQSVATREGRTLALVATFVQSGVEKAEISMDGHTYTVRTGESFGGGFEATSISAGCVT